MVAIEIDGYRWHASASAWADDQIWGFDLSMEEDHPETWVRPYSFVTPPQESDVLFIAAKLVSADGKHLDGALSFRMVRGEPTGEGVILLAPRYMGLRHDDSGKVVMDDFSWSYVKKAYPRVESLFPLSYEASVQMGRRTFNFEGTLELE
jgi:hypothetical protein